MKFGASFKQRSVPQWSVHNIDYAAVKKLIRESTTPGQGRAIAIPGKSPDHSIALEEHIAGNIQKEHDKTSLFVKYKFAELNSRFRSIENKLARVKRKRAVAGHSHFNPDGRLARIISEVESEILETGEEIQNLGRFISVNRQAIKKLSKKFKKWGESTTFDDRINAITDGPNSFTKIPLDSAFDTYRNFLDDLRSSVETRSDTRDDLLIEAAVTDKERYAPFSKSGVEFDMALESSDLDTSSTRAVYWVHRDNVVELSVLLLQHLQYARFAKATSPTNGRARLIDTADTDTPDAKRDSIGSFVLENREPTSYLHGAGNWVDSPIPFCIARWSISGDVLINDNRPNSTSTLQRLTFRPSYPTLKMPSDALLLSPLTDHETSDEEAASGAARTASQRDLPLRTWIERNPHLKATVQTRCRRSRFVGLDNDSSQGVWAAMDEDLTMHTISSSEIRSGIFVAGQATAQVFPHALLTLRAHAPNAAQVIRLLDQSHLAERVFGFSRETHALASLIEGTPKPHWFEMLDKDIRHVPTPSSSTITSQSDNSRRSSLLKTSLSSTETPVTTVSNDTAAIADPSAINGTKYDAGNAKLLKTSARKLNFDAGAKSSSRRIRSGGRRGYDDEMDAEESQQEPQQRYWNEYDDPSSSVAGDLAYQEEQAWYAENGAVLDTKPSSPVFSALKRRFRKMFNMSPTARDVEAQRSYRAAQTPTTENFSSSGEEEDDDNYGEEEYSPTSPLLHHGQLMYASQARYGAMLHKTSPRPKRFKSSSTSRRMSTTPTMLLFVLLCLGAAFVAVPSFADTEAISGNAAAEGLIIVAFVFGIALALVGLLGLLFIFCTSTNEDDDDYETPEMRRRDRIRGSISSD